MAIREVLTKFAEQTTMHGVPKVRKWFQLIEQNNMEVSYVQTLRDGYSQMMDYYEGYD